MKARTIMTTVVCVLGVAAGSAMAKPGKGPGPNQPMMSPVMAQLELSQSQQQQLAELQKQHQADRAALQAQRPDPKTMQKKMNALLTAKKFDEKAVKKLLTQQQEQREQMAEKMMLMQLKHKHDMLQILTPEQQEKFLLLDSVMGNRQGFGQGNGPQGNMRGGKGMGPGNGMGLGPNAGPGCPQGMLPPPAELAN